MESSIQPPVAPLRPRLELKMEVYSAEEEFIGEVKELGELDFLVDRPMQRDLYVPYDVVETVTDHVRVSTPLDEIDQSGWDTTATRRK